MSDKMSAEPGTPLGRYRHLERWAETQPWYNDFSSRPWELDLEDYVKAHHTALHMIAETTLDGGNYKEDPIELAQRIILTHERKLNEVSEFIELMYHREDQLPDIFKLNIFRLQHIIPHYSECNAVRAARGDMAVCMVPEEVREERQRCNCWKSKIPEIEVPKL